MKKWTRTRFVFAMGLGALLTGATLGAREASACETCLIPPPSGQLAFAYYTADGHGHGGYTCLSRCSSATGYCCHVVIVEGP